MNFVTTIITWFLNKQIPLWKKIIVGVFFSIPLVLIGVAYLVGKSNGKVIVNPNIPVNPNEVNIKPNQSGTQQLPPTPQLDNTIQDILADIKKPGK